MNKLTRQQHQVLQMENFVGGSGANLTSSFYKHGNFNNKQLFDAIKQLFSENDSLRLSLIKHKSGIYQKFLTMDKLNFESRIRTFKTAEEMEEYAQDKAYEIISYNQLVNIIPFIIGGDGYGIIIQMHHIAGDGWSIGNIMKRFSALISNSNLEKTAPDLDYQFKDHIKKEEQYYQSNKAQKDKEYWENTFVNFSESTFLSDKEITSFKSARFGIEITEEQMNKINTFSKQTGRSFFTIYLGALATYLARIKRQEKFCIGTALLNRRKIEQQTSGMFVNTVGLAIPVSKEESFSSIIENTQKILFGSIRRMKVDFSEVVEELRNEINQFKGALYDVYLSYQNISANNEAEVGIIKWYHCGIQPESLAININDWVDTGILKFEYDYQVEKFSEEDILFLHDQIMELLLSGIDNPLKKVKELALCDEKQQKKILTEYNQPTIDPTFYSIIERFEKKVAENPDSIAIECEENKITYQELDNTSSDIAFQLEKLGAIGTNVALHIKSGYKQIIAIMAVLKAGATYVPIDVTIPEDRKKFIMNEIEPKVILCDETEFLAIETSTKLELLDRSKNEVKDYHFQRIRVKEQDPAYILFTSGTTGKPKGVVVNHRNLSHYGEVCKNYFNLNYETRVLQQATYSFDIFVEEVFPTLIAGGTIIIFPRDETMSFESLAACIVEQQITMISCTPLVVKELAKQNALDEVEIIISGGDVLKSEYINSLVKKGKRVYNTYGPTETTVCACYHEIKSSDSQRTTLLIGKPIKNVQIYILIEKSLAGIGVQGEICIGGAGVTTGYFKNQALTDERFIDNPFGPGKLYRSGDLGYYTSDGELEYSGRIDNQVKIRGYRVETAEIEEVLKSNSLIKDAFVRVNETKEGINHLSAYIIGTKLVDNLVLKDYLREKLPEYMIPNQFLQLDKFPINLNGKIDINFLPEIIVEYTNYEAPTTKTEKKVIQLVEDILELENIGRNADFFELGGHSLKAMQLGTRLNQQFNVNVSLHQLFKFPVIHELAALIDQSEYSSQIIPKVKKSEQYQASPAQKRLFLVQKIQDSQSKVYNMPVGLAFKGKIELDRLQQAFTELEREHEILRTTFQLENGEVVQIVSDSCRLKVEEIALSEDTLQTELDKFIQPFNLNKGPLIRLGIQQRTQNSYYLFFDMHHIISDGLSLTLLFKELERRYHEKFISELPIQYVDYSSWINKKNKGETKEYWMNYLEGFEERLALPLDFSRPKIQQYNGNKLKYSLQSELNELIYKLSKDLETTPYVFFASIWFILLQKYSMQKDITIGTGFAGRSGQGTEKLIGLFVNTVVLRADVSEDKTYYSFLQELKKRIITIFDYQDYPFEQLLEDIGNQVDPSRHPLFDVMYTYQNNDELSFSLDGGELIEEVYDETIAKFDLQFEVVESNQAFSIEILYNTDLFMSETIRYLFQQSESLIRAISEDLYKPIAKLSPVNKEEKNKILNEFNHWKLNEKEVPPLKELIEKMLIDYPGEIAFSSEGKQVTYEKMVEKVRIFAQILQKHNVEEGDKVAIIADKSADTIIAILATAFISAVYVPIDPLAPADRKMQILDDAKPYVIIEQGEVTTTGIRKEPATFYEDPIAYIMYTSGTTGRPRGVVIRQSSIVKLAQKCNFTQINEETIVLQTGSMAFDAATFEIWGTFLNGAKLVLISKEEMLDVVQLNKVINQESVNFMFITTAFFNFLIDQDRHLFDPIQQLFVGGEKASINHMRTLLQKNATIQLANIYGPTENTTFSTVMPITLASTRIPIGYPLKDTAVYIMQDEELVGVGMVGEICLAGDGIADGYYGLPELTKEKFIPNPFGKGRLYKSGDLGRFLADGSIEYIGRLDDQVKIRGYRIELQEIQFALTELASIKEAYVDVHETANKEPQIVAYVVADKPYTLENVRTELMDKLPDYMLPSQMHQMAQLPLNQNGKVDKKMLPKGPIKSGKRTIIPAENKMEQMLINIFEEIINVKPIGRMDEFFVLGGHSLKAMQAVNRIEEQLQIKLSLRDLFAYPQIASLAKFIKKQQPIELTTIQKIKEKDFYPVSSAQKRLYLIQKMQSSAKIAYNMPVYLAYEGQLNHEKLEVAFTKLVENHEILRTNFVIVDGIPMQKINKHQKLKCSIIEGQEPIASIFTSFIQPFNLEKDLLVRIGSYENNEGKYLLFDMHHIISDGFSVNILLDELAQLYNGNDCLVPALQYKDYSAWLEKYDFNEAKEYWKQEILDMPETFDLFHDRSRTMEQKYQGCSFKKVLSHETTKRINTFAVTHQMTPYMIFIAAFMLLLLKKSAQNQIRIGVPVSGRINKETESMLGLFINTIVIQNDIDKAESVSNFLEQIKQKTIMADEYQAYPLDQLIEELNIETDSARNPLFDVMFSFQNNAPMEFNFSDITVEKIKTVESVTKFDLNLDVLKEEEQYVLDFIYREDLFYPETIETLADYMEIILSNMIEGRSETIAELSLTTDKEKIQILTQFNQPESLTKIESFTLAERFHQTARKFAKREALIDSKESINYQELEKRVLSLARNLREEGGQKGDLVAVYAEQNNSTIISILAILELEMAYLLIDTDLPEERKQYLFEDGNVQFFLKENSKTQKIEFERVHVNNKNSEQHIDDLAYIMYTSGTTGQPKGVQITQENILSFIFGNNFILLDEEIRMLHTSAMSFDATTFEIFGTLLFGGSLTLVPTSDIVNVDTLAKIIEKNSINCLFLTTALFNLLIDENPLIFSQITYLLIGGEKASMKHMRKVKESSPNTKIYNMYGPTETTTFATAYEIPNEFKEIPIGVPIMGKSIYILDGLQLCGIGLPGEICIGGLGVSRGYINSPTVTQEKFIPNPFGEGELYRTGDIGYFQKDGTVIYLDRADQQVKIRGFRIELMEIEAALKKIATIKSAVVNVKKLANGDQVLRGYIVSNLDLDLDSIKRELRNKIPHYMIPARMIQIESIPLNKNGKVDLNNLPDIEEIRITAENPQTEKERILFDVLEEIVGTSFLTRTSDFFEIGGDSIKAMRLVSKIKDNGFDLSLEDIMNYRQLDLIAKQMKGTELRTWSQEAYTGDIGLSAIQKEWLDWGFPNNDFFSQGVMLYSDELLEVDAVKKTLEELIKVHDNLRLTYRMGEKKAVISTYADKSPTYLIEVVDLRTLDSTEISQLIMNKNELIQRKIHLDEGPLVACIVYQNQISGTSELFLDIHHMVVDGVSWRILLEEFTRIYPAIKNGLPYKQPEKTADYADWIMLQEKYIQTEEADLERKYWENLSSAKTTIWSDQLVKQTKSQRKNEMIALSAELTAQILGDVSLLYNTEMNDLLVSGVVAAVAQTFKKKKIIVELEGHGRHIIDNSLDLEKSIGWYTSMYPVQITYQKNIEQFIRGVKMQLRNVPHKGVMYLPLRHSQKPIPDSKGDVLFNFLGDFDSEYFGDFTQSKYDTGIQTDPANNLLKPLMINSSIKDGVLRFELTYNTQLIGKRQIDSFSEALKNYFVSLSKHVETRTKKDNLEWLESDALKDIDFNQVMKKYDSPIQIEEVIQTDPVTFAQNIFINQTKYNGLPICACVVRLEHSISRVRIIETINLLIASQPALRQVIDESGENNLTLSKEYEWPIPYFFVDNQESKTILEEKMKIIPQNTALFTDTGLMAKHFIVRNEDGSHEIYIYAHHAIWDLSSLTVWQREFERLLKEENHNSMLIGHESDIEVAETNGSLSESQFEFFNETKKYSKHFRINRLNLFNLTTNEFKTYKLDKVYQQVIDAPLLTALKLMEVTVQSNLKAEISKIPFFILSHGRNKDNQNKIGLFIQLECFIYEGKNKLQDSLVQKIQSIWTGENIGDCNFEKIAKRAGMSEEKMMHLVKKLPIINVSTLLDASFTENFEEQTENAEAFGDTIGSIQLQLRKEVVKLVVTTTTQMTEKIESVMLKN